MGSTTNNINNITKARIYVRHTPHVDATSPCAMSPVSQGSGGGVFANDNEEQRAIEQRSIEQRSKPEKKST